MEIGPQADTAARALLGHALQGDRGAYAAAVTDAGQETFLECLGLCLRVAGYVAIDACGQRWPSDKDVARIAEQAAAADPGLGLTELAVYDFLAHCVLGLEPLTRVFPDREQAAAVPVFATAALLVSYRRPGTGWQDYLEQIQEGLEEAGALSANAFPAALLLSRKSRPPGHQAH